MTALLEKAPDLVKKVRRRAARYVHTRPLSPVLERGLVSLSFDDCPRSVFETALPMIEAKGWRATIYASMGLCDTTNHLGLHMSETDMVLAHEAGHEIADHTFSHMDAMAAGPDRLREDIDRNRAVFARLGLPEARTFAFPYGEVTVGVKRALAKEFDLARGIHSPSGSSVDLNLAPAGRLYSTDMAETLQLLEQCAAEKTWLILFGHDVREDCSEFGCTPDELSLILNRIEQLGLDVATVRDGLEMARS